MNNQYGIVSVTFDKAENLFCRRWVTLPDGSPRLFDCPDSASKFAEDMTKAAHSEGILSVGYRPRTYGDLHD